MGKRQKAETRKPQILEHYYRVIAEEGVEGASIGKIGKHMGIHPSLLIHYFGTKDDMTLALMDNIMGSYPKRALWENVEKASGPEERFEELMNTVFGEASSKAVDNVVFYGLHSVSFRNNEMRDTWKTTYSAFREILAAELESYAKEGLAEIADPEMAAQLIICLREGIDFRGSFMPGGGPSEALRESAREAVMTVLKGRKGRKTKKLE
jgi:AcrR family transcriptional regulator